MLQDLANLMVRNLLISSLYLLRAKSSDSSSFSPIIRNSLYMQLTAQAVINCDFLGFSLLVAFLLTQPQGTAGEKNWHWCHRGTGVENEELHRCDPESQPSRNFLSL